MLTVIIDASQGAEKLPALLAQLTAGAVEGLVREVLIAGPASGPVASLCDETGAEPVETLALAIVAAKAAQLLVVPAALRLQEGWLTALGAHLSAGGVGGVLPGLSAGYFAPRPYGVLLPRARAASLAHPDLRRLRRELGVRPPRLG